MEQTNREYINREYIDMGSLTTWNQHDNHSKAYHTHQQMFAVPKMITHRSKWIKQWHHTRHDDRMRQDDEHSHYENDKSI